MLTSTLEILRSCGKLRAGVQLTNLSPLLCGETLIRAAHVKMKNFQKAVALDVSA